MKKERVKGRFEEAKGKVKEFAGQAVSNKELERKGTIQKNAGKVQAGVEDIQKNS
ncbi:general stress protein CsbD [Thiocystis minor]|uniref:CsbD family protein n=1 Tax=Thiocystis minor TaxID=61597 RepID=UPI001913A9C4|nr:CsbD family protein [Thiocystis minor]MBK5962981.1 general stress protein CsbD [Thiocystis minor]